MPTCSAACSGAGLPATAARPQPRHRVTGTVSGWRIEANAISNEGTGTVPQQNLQAGWSRGMFSACDTAMRRNEVDEEFRAEQVAAARRARGVAAAALPCAADPGLSSESAAARPDAAGRAPAPLDAGPLPAHVAREVLRALVDPEVPLHMLMASGKQATP